MFYYVNERISLVLLEYIATDTFSSHDDNDSIYRNHGKVQSFTISGSSMPSAAPSLFSFSKFCWHIL